MKKLMTIFLMLAGGLALTPETLAVGTVGNDQIMPYRTGGRNYIKNPSGTNKNKNFVVGTTSPAASVAFESGAGYRIDGIGSISCDSSAQNGACSWQMDTPQAPDTSGACVLSAYYKGDASKYKFRLYDSGGNTLAESPLLSNATDWTLVEIDYGCQLTAPVGARLIQTESGDGAKVYVGYLNYSRKFSSVQSVITREISYTPTITGAGTVSNNVAYYQQIGQDIRVYGSFTAGTVDGSLASISLPSGLVLDTTRISISNTTSNPGTMFGRYSQNGGSGNFNGPIVTAPATSTTLVYLGANDSASTNLTPTNGSSNLNSSNVVSYDFTVPISNLNGTIDTARTPIITPWTSYTPTTAGLGIVSAVNFQWRQVGQNVEIKGKLTAGTSTADEMRIGLPNGYISAGSPLIPSIMVVGQWVKTATDIGPVVLIEPSVGYMTFSFQSSGGSGGLNKVNGNTSLTSGQTMSMFASIPIAGLGGTITSPGGWRNFGVMFASDASASTVCSSNPCALVTDTNIDNAITGVSRSGTGTYSATIAAGVCGSKPVCNVTGNQLMGRIDGAATPTAIPIEFRTGANATADVIGNINCTCKRP